MTNDVLFYSAIVGFTLAVLSISFTLFVIISNTRRTKDVERLLAVQERSLVARQIQLTSDAQRLVQREKIATRNKIEQIIEEKKQRFLNVSLFLFHFIEEERVKEFYQLYFREPIVESLVSEISGEVSGDVKGSVPQILESHITGKDANKQISTIKYPEPNLSSMYLQFLKETIKNGQVHLGIEELDIELTELERLKDEIKKLKTEFDIDIDEETQKDRESHIKEKAADKTIIKMTEAKDWWVLIEGSFKIDRQGNLYKYTYDHPVNEFLPDQNHRVTISVLLPIDSLKEHIKEVYVQSVGSEITVTIYGKVLRPINRKTNVWDLQILPLAIY